ncbi:ribosomal RNA-processing protein A [Trifolium repens]|nr:ribosomal RNA-processing protein A [Trifolium repens]
MKKRNMEQNTDVETVNVVERQRPEDEEQVDLQDQIGRSKDAKKKRRREVPKSPEKREQDHHQNECHIISSGDDDCLNGIKKWILECQQSRQQLEVLQHQIDDFITAYEEKLEEERKAKEALAAEGGWTVVEHHKGRKKTTDSESGIVVGSVAQAAVENKLARKKPKELGLDLYRIQKREAQRNEIMELQGKFEEDKKRLQHLRAARKFRPY